MTPRPASPAATEALPKLRRLALTFDRVDETLTFGNPTFNVGKRAFAVLDRYKGIDCLWLRVDRMERNSLLGQEGWFAAPYDPRKQALCVELAAIDWRRIRPLLRISYWLAAS
jgi:hypothetical protein